MTRAYLVALLLSAMAFLGYGIACLAFDGMKREFERFGLERWRLLTGALEVLGAVGLLAGLAWPPLAGVSAAGLALLMGAGVGTRLRVLDSVAQTLPAMALLAINVFVAWVALAR